MGTFGKSPCSAVSVIQRSRNKLIKVGKKFGETVDIFCMNTKKIRAFRKNAVNLQGEEHMGVSEREGAYESRLGDRHAGSRKNRLNTWERAATQRECHSRQSGRAWESVMFQRKKQTASEHSWKLTTSPPSQNLSSHLLLCPSLEDRDRDANKTLEPLNRGGLLRQSLPVPCLTPAY